MADPPGGVGTPSPGSMADVSQPSPLAALQHRALALRAAGDVAGACRLLADAIDPLKASFGEDHPEVLGTAHLLARLHREADDPAAARRVLEEALAAGERRWHPADPLMLAFSFDLASVAEELGNRHEARRHYARVADAGPAVLGADHPAVQAARHYLGGAGAGTTPPLPPGPLVAPGPRDSARSPVPPAFPRQPPPPLPVSAPPRQLPPPPPRIPAPSRSPESTATATTRHASEPPHPAAAPGVPPVPPVAAPPTAAAKPPSGTDAPPQQPVSPWAPQAAPPAPRIPAPPRPGPGGQGGPVPPPPVSAAHGGTVAPRQARPETMRTGGAAPADAASAWAPQPAAEGGRPAPASQAPTPAVPPTPRTAPAPPGPRAPAEPAPPSSPPPAPARGWDEPTVQVRQIDPLLREEAARQEAIRAATEPGGDTSPTPATGAAPPVGASPVGGPVSDAPASAPPTRDAPVGGRPGSVAPVSGSPVSSAPISGTPVSGTPVSGSPVPPWGMTAPPWSRVSPPRSPAEPVGAEPTARDGAEPTAPNGAEPTAPDMAGHPQGESTHPPRPLGQGHGAAHPDVPAPPPAPDRRPAARPHQPPWPGQGAVEPGPVGHEHAPVEHGPVAQGWDGQPGQGGPAWPERGGREADDGYPSPREAWQTTYPQEEQAGRGRLLVVVAVAVALVVLVVMVGVAVLVLGRDGAPPPTQATPPSAAAGPTVDGPPPGDLKLRDDSSTITLTWTDPSAGAVPFMVAGGRAGQKLGVMATVDPGQTSYTVNGLNARVDYCFTVLAVYSTDAFATSGQVCTQRERTATPR